MGEDDALTLEIEDADGDGQEVTEEFQILAQKSFKF